MRISTPHYLEQMKGKASPFGFVLHPRTRSKLKLTLLTPFTKKRANWEHSECINTHDGEKCKPHTRGLLRRIIVHGGLQHCIGKEVSLKISMMIAFIMTGRRVAANEGLIAEISARGLRRTTKETGLDRKTIRAILGGKKVKTSTLAKIVTGLRKE
jgi:hypothetical protein